MITKNKMVSVSYELRTEQNGELLEAAGADRPLDFICGQPQEIFKDVEAEEMVVGHVLPMMDSVGRRLQGKILSIGDEEVRIDFNHPLAGKDLFFKGEILGVRDATDEELEALHSHKCGGCSGCGSEGGCGSHDEGCGCGGCH